MSHSDVTPQSLIKQLRFEFLSIVRVIFRKSQALEKVLCGVYRNNWVVSSLWMPACLFLIILRLQSPIGFLSFSAFNIQGRIQAHPGNIQLRVQSLCRPAWQNEDHPEMTPSLLTFTLHTPFSIFTIVFAWSRDLLLLWLLLFCPCLARFIFSRTITSISFISIYYTPFTNLHNWMNRMQNKGNHIVLPIFFFFPLYASCLCDKKLSVT